MKYKYFYSFLVKHNKEVAEEVNKTYINTIGKIYFTNFQNYVSNIMKLEVKIGVKNDLIVEQETSLYSSLLNFGSKNLSNKGKKYLI
jgi:hypothetical protein